MEQWKYFKTYDGVPQGSGISPILSNIYLSELDKCMDDYKAEFNIGSSNKRQRSRKYKNAVNRAYIYKKRGAELWDNLTMEERRERTKELRFRQSEIRKLPAAVPHDEMFKSVVYTRYADDFLIGVIGSREDAQKVKDDVRQFLADRLHLKMSDEKTKITHTGDRARFLGYDVTVSRAQNAVKKKDGRTQRCHSYVVKLLVPREKWVGKLLEYKAMKVVINQNGKERYKALHRGKLINLPDIDILSAYNSEIRGLYNFYSIANDSYKIGIFANIMKYSMFKTFANKYRTNVNVIKGRYFEADTFTVEYPTKSGTRKAVYYNGGFSRKMEATIFAEVSFLPQYKRYDKVNSLRNRIKSGVCELCGNKTDNIALHQVKRMKDLKGVKPWEIIMLERRRKTLAVCPTCHSEIHP
jgi:hypothetical protein